MKFSYNWLQSFFTKKLPPPEKLAEILTMRAFEVEEVNKIKVGKSQDWQLEIDVLPNRTDCYSHFGMAREIGAILNLKMKTENWRLKEEENLQTKDFVSIKVKAGCQRYCARVLIEPKIEESPDFIKERLEVCGLKPINNVVDITNYVMLELGQPLHAFDLEKVEDRQIIVRLAKEGEEILTLDNEEYKLDESILVIADSKKPIGIAGIKGGKNSGISERTKILLLESANFDPVLIRRASIKIDLKTDAALRFSHGLDPNLAEVAANRAAFLIQQICKAKVAKGILDYYPQKVLPKKIKLDKNYLESLLGIKISTKEIVTILKNLGFELSKNLVVTVPTFRRDVSIQEDLIEEVGRIYGYEKIEKKFPTVLLCPPRKNFDLFWEERAKDILKEIGFFEVLNYSFVSKDDIENFGFKEEAIEIENPVSANFQFLRPTLLVNLLKNVQKNQKNFPEIKIFEIGKIFKKEKQTKKEKKALSFVISGNKFFEAKGIIDTLFKKLGISNFYFDFFKPTPEETKSTIWQKGKTAEIRIGDKEVGFLGMISRKILEKYEIEKDLVAVDIDFDLLSKLATEEQEFEPISPYPPIIRDISILVPKDVLVETVISEIERSGGELIRDIDLFDIFEEIEPERKSLTFRIIFQAKDRAILPKELDQIWEKIIENLEKNQNWEVRKK